MVWTRIAPAAPIVGSSPYGGCARLRVHPLLARQHRQPRAGRPAIATVPDQTRRAGAGTRGCDRSPRRPDDGASPAAGQQVGHVRASRSSGSSTRSEQPPIPRAAAYLTLLRSSMSSILAARDEPVSRKRTADPGLAALRLHRRGRGRDDHVQPAREAQRLTFEVYADLRDLVDRASPARRRARAGHHRRGSRASAPAATSRRSSDALTRMRTAQLLEFTRMTGSVVQAMRECPLPSSRRSTGSPPAPGR